MVQERGAHMFDMKDINLVHYFKGLEIWQGIGDIFLGHEKYTVEIWKKFQMMDDKSLANPMIPNMMLSNDSDSNLVDPSLYM